MVGIRVALNLRYLAGNYAFNALTQIVNAFNFQTYAGQFFSQLLRSDINIYSIDANMVSLLI